MGGHSTETALSSSLDVRKSAFGGIDVLMGSQNTPESVSYYVTDNVLSMEAHTADSKGMRSSDKQSAAASQGMSPS